MTTKNTISENLTEGQLKAIALMQFNNEPFFFTESNVYTGEEDAAKESYEAVKDDYESFDDFCSNECDEVEEIDGTEERDGYIVLTDEEAQTMCSDYIKQSLWAFNASFLSQETGIDQSVFEAIQANGKCEDNNDAIESCIDDIEGFIEAAISADGRGHFISTYDGEESEETVADETFYIYRIN